MYKVYNVYMKRKPISLKRLFIMASLFLIEVANEESLEVATKQMDVIKKYLKFVAIHKEDEL